MIDATDRRGPLSFFSLSAKRRCQKMVALDQETVSCFWIVESKHIARLIPAF